MRQYYFLSTRILYMVIIYFKYVHLVPYLYLLLTSLINQYQLIFTIVIKLYSCRLCTQMLWIHKHYFEQLLDKLRVNVYSSNIWTAELVKILPIYFNAYPNIYGGVQNSIFLFFTAIVFQFTSVCKLEWNCNNNITVITIWRHERNMRVKDTYLLSPTTFAHLITWVCAVKLTSVPTLPTSDYVIVAQALPENLITFYINAYTVTTLHAASNIVKRVLVFIFLDDRYKRSEHKSNNNNNEKTITMYSYSKNVLLIQCNFDCQTSDTSCATAMCTTYNKYRQFYGGKLFRIKITKLVCFRRFQWHIRIEKIYRKAQWIVWLSKFSSIIYSIRFFVAQKKIGDFILLNV